MPTSQGPHKTVGTVGLCRPKSRGKRTSRGAIARFHSADDIAVEDLHIELMFPVDETALEALDWRSNSARSDAPASDAAIEG